MWKKEKDGKALFLQLVLKKRLKERFWTDPPPSAPMETLQNTLRPLVCGVSLFPTQGRVLEHTTEILHTLLPHSELTHFFLSVFPGLERSFPQLPSDFYVKAHTEEFTGVSYRNGIKHSELFFSFVSNQIVLGIKNDPIRSYSDIIFPFTSK